MAQGQLTSGKRWFGMRLRNSPVVTASGDESHSLQSLAPERSITIVPPGTTVALWAPRVPWGRARGSGRGRFGT